MPRHHFTEEEARAKIGKRIRSLLPFSGVQQGITGRVTSAHERTGGYDVIVEWDTLKLRDWFTKDEYERFLEEIEPKE